MTIDRKIKTYKIVCPECKKERFIAYAQNWNIEKGNSSGLCHKCRKGGNVEGLKKGQGWNRGLNISGMSGKKQSEKCKEIRRKMNLEDNPAKRPEVKNKMRKAKLGKVGNNLGKHWKVKDTSRLGVKNRGENHWKWKTDRTQIKQGSIERRSPKYKEWRKSVCDRDKWKCKINNQDCSGRLEVHHILGFTDYPELRYEINNGIALCHAHHPRKRAEEKQLIQIFTELVVVQK